MIKPNWNEWEHTPEVSIWQACALSLNLDPHSMHLDRNGWMAGPGNGPFFDIKKSFPNTNTKDEFNLRMRVLVANWRNPDHFSTPVWSPSAAVPGNNNVNLAEFSEWAQSVVKWEIPTELAEISKHGTRPEPKSPPSRFEKGMAPTIAHANVSDKLAKMNQASMKFWSNAGRDDRGTHTDNATVAAWLVQQGFSPTLADKAATIIRPEWVPTGRKPDE